MKTILTYTAILTLLATFGYSQNYNTKSLKGPWLEDTVWVDDNAPLLGSVNNQNIFINGTITFDGDIVLRNNNDITVNSSDTLIVTGNFNLNNNSNIIIAENGVFLVFGDFESNNNLDIETGGVVAIFGNFITSNFDLEINVDGSMYVFGESSLSDPESIGIQSGNDFLLGEGDLVTWIESEYDIDLPIELKSFDIAYTNNTFLFEWITSSETDNDFFTIEYSLDGYTFSEIAYVNGSGTSSIENSYSHSIYNNQISGIVYVRLKQTDYNGNYTYSEIQVIEITHKSIDIIVFPNPVVHELFIESSDSIELVTITNLHSHIVAQYTVRNNESVNVSMLQNGIYIIEVQTDKGITHTQFIKK